MCFRVTQNNESQGSFLVGEDSMTQSGIYCSEASPPTLWDCLSFFIPLKQRLEDTYHCWPRCTGRALRGSVEGWGRRHLKLGGDPQCQSAVDGAPGCPSSWRRWWGWRCWSAESRGAEWDQRLRAHPPTVEAWGDCTSARKRKEEGVAQGQLGLSLAREPHRGPSMCSFSFTTLPKTLLHLGFWGQIKGSI